MGIKALVADTVARFTPVVKQGGKTIYKTARTYSTKGEALVVARNRKQMISEKKRKK